MSNNPFREDSNPTRMLHKSQNAPYENPSSNPLTIPAVVLLVLASLILALFIASLTGQFIRLSAIDTSYIKRWWGELAGGIVTLIVWPLMNLMVIIGAISMLRLKSYRNACAAAVFGIDSLLHAMLCAWNSVWNMVTDLAQSRGC